MRPRTIDWVAGDALREKSGAETTSVALVECVVAPPVPVMVRGYVPAGVVDDVVTVRVEESAGFGAKLALVPAGRPPTDSVTESAKPPVRETLTV